MRAERCRRPDDRAQVPRVGDAVQGDDERLLCGVAGTSEQVIGVGVGVGPDPERDSLVDGAAGEPVELGPAGFDHGDSLARGKGDGLADPLVGVQPRADVQRDHRDRRAQ